MHMPAALYIGYFCCSAGEYSYYWIVKARLVVYILYII